MNLFKTVPRWICISGLAVIVRAICYDNYLNIIIGIGIIIFGLWLDKKYYEV